MEKQRKAKRVSSDRTWHGFINNHITKTDIQNIKAMDISGEDILLRMGELAEAGYDIKIAFDNYSNCLSIIMMGKEASGPDNGWAISARHTFLPTAIKELFYRHATFADDQGNWLKPLDKDTQYNY